MRYNSSEGRKLVQHACMRCRCHVSDVSWGGFTSMHVIVGFLQASWPNVAMLTAIPPMPCKAPLADLINSLSLVNKVRTY